jgi:CRISPR type III-A-associated protein Csm2
MLTKEDLTIKAKQQAKEFFVQKQYRGQKQTMPDGHPKWDENKSLTSSQLRKFFGEFKRIKMKLDNLIKNNTDKDKTELFKSVIPQIMLQAAQVNYAAGRNKIPDSFRTFLLTHLDNLKEDNPDSFYEFMTFFEAVVGYYYYIAQKGDMKKQ